jgi:ATP/maltotriose-dependent transcriptional regulator MalT
MELFLLTTKLRIPPQPDRSILRERLTNALERAIAGRKLTLFAAGLHQAVPAPDRTG